MTILLNEQSITEAKKLLIAGKDTSQQCSRSRKLVSICSLAQALELIDASAAVSQRSRKRLFRELQRPNRIAQDHKRRATKRRTCVGPRWQQTEFIQWARTANGIKCYWCHKKVSRDDRQIDHIIPLAKGGADHVHNLCVSCSRCNQSKNDKMPEQFSGQGELALVPVTDVGPSKRDRIREMARVEAGVRRDAKRAEAKRVRELMKTRAHLVPLCAGDTAFVPLTRGKWAMIDKADWPSIGVHMWAAQLKGGYWRAKRNDKKVNGIAGIVLMNRQVAGVTERSTHVKHSNGVQLDCRRANLAIHRTNCGSLEEVSGSG